MPGARRLRYLIVLAVLGIVLLGAAIVSGTGCGRSDPVLAGGGQWSRYFGSVAFVLVGWGPLALDALGHVFAKRGWEPDYRPIRLTYEGTDEELTSGGRMWVAYPLMVIFGCVGLWLWIGLNGCDVIIVPGQGRQ